MIIVIQSASKKEKKKTVNYTHEEAEKISSYLPLFMLECRQDRISNSWRKSICSRRQTNRLTVLSRIEIRLERNACLFFSLSLSFFPSYLVTLLHLHVQMCEQIIYGDDNDDEDPSNEMFATSRLRLTFIERCVNRLNENVLFYSNEKRWEQEMETNGREKEKRICLFNH